MKQSSYFFLLFALLSTSCTKTVHDVHFHGRVTLECDNQIPVSNCEVVIRRVYDNGQSQVDVIGTTYTNSYGYYSLIADVKQEGSFMFYGFEFYTGDLWQNTSSLEYGGAVDTKDNGDDIEVNGKATNSKIYKFHIKNISPFNSGDLFNELLVKNNSPTTELTNISNLIGVDVDTTFFQYYFNQPNIEYKYSYTKNGILTSIPLDTLTTPSCLDTVTVNIFY